MKQQAKYLSHFHGDILVRCPRCSACAHLVALQRADTTHLGHRLVCALCGHSAEWNFDADGLIPLPASGPRLAGFNLDLWLVTPCCGETLWAYNREHVEFLQSYIAARLRSQFKHPEHGWSNQSMQSRLPAWMLSRANRDTVLHGLQKLLLQLP